MLVFNAIQIENRKVHITQYKNNECLNDPIVNRIRC